MNKIAKLVRFCTVPVFCATFLILFMWFGDKFTSVWHFVMALALIVLFPLIGYPISFIIPKLKAGGQYVQRRLVIVLSVIGYLIGLVLLLVFKGNKYEYTLLITYAGSAFLIALTSFLFHFDSSGHACGVAGPIAIGIWMFGWKCAIFYIVLLGVFWSSYVLKRHKLSELIVGSLMSTLIILLCSCLF